MKGLKYEYVYVIFVQLLLSLQPSVLRFRRHYVYIELNLQLETRWLFKIWIFITKTSLFKYIEKFTNKKGKFSDKKILIIFIILLKTYIMGIR